MSALRTTAAFCLGLWLMASFMAMHDDHDNQSISVPYKALMAMERK